MASRTSISRDNLQSVLRIPPVMATARRVRFSWSRAYISAPAARVAATTTKLIAILACESMAASRRNPGPRNPSSAEKEREGQVHHSGRNPHHQAGKLLILKRGETAQ